MKLLYILFLILLNPFMILVVLAGWTEDKMGNAYVEIFITLFLFGIYWSWWEFIRELNPKLEREVSNYIK